MNENRRNFLRKIGLVATLTGYQSALPAACLAETAKEVSVLASADLAIVETRAGKVRGYVHRSKIRTG